MEGKACRVCGESKPLTEFDHGQSRCKACRRTAVNARNATPEGRAYRRAAGLKYVASHPDYVSRNRLCSREFQRKLRATPEGREKANRRIQKSTSPNAHLPVAQRPTTVYSVARASDQVVVYIGSTSLKLRARLGMHRAEARHLETDTRPWYVWLRENEGTELDIVALEECPNRAKAHKAEAEAIKQLRRAGAVLFNEGIPTEAEGNKHSKRTRRKMSVAQRLAA